MKAVVQIATAQHSTREVSMEQVVHRQSTLQGRCTWVNCMKSDAGCRGISMPCHVPPILSFLM